MQIVAFLQNQWFKNPERHKRFAEKYPDLREEMIWRFLFAGCKTGRVLKTVFEDRCDDFIWEETSREVGGFSGAIFKPDYDHINAVCIKHSPDIILAFGKQATEALQNRNGLEYLICGPHPANRRADETLKLLRDMRWRLETLEEAYKNGERALNHLCNFA